MRFISINEGRFATICKDGSVKDLQDLVNEYPEEDFKRAATKALPLVAEMGQLDFVKYLIEEHQADIHENEDMPLCLATGSGRLPVIMYLVEECQGKVNAISGAALYCAVDRGYLSAVKYMIKQGVDYKYYREKNENAYNMCHKIAQDVEVTKDFKENVRTIRNVERLQLHGSARPVRRRPSPYKV